MPVQSAYLTGSASSCPTSQRTVTAPPPSPDLFGFVAPASTPTASTRPSTRRTTATAEWPAAGASPPPPPSSSPRPTAAADRGPRSGGTLSGTYDRTGATLRRSDGIALTVCLSHRGVRTARDSGRYVTVATPGGGKPRYAGNLYADPNAGDDLAGEFQDVQGRTRYALRPAGADRYTVAPVLRRRGGRVSP